MCAEYPLKFFCASIEYASYYCILNVEKSIFFMSVGFKSFDWTRFHCIVDVYHDTSISTIRLSTDKTCLSWSIFMRILFHKKKEEKTKSIERLFANHKQEFTPISEYVVHLFVFMAIFLCYKFHHVWSMNQTMKMREKSSIIGFICVVIKRSHILNSFFFIRSVSSWSFF